MLCACNAADITAKLSEEDLTALTVALTISVTRSIIGLAVCAYLLFAIWGSLWMCICEICKNIENLSKYGQPLPTHIERTQEEKVQSKELIDRMIAFVKNVRIKNETHVESDVCNICFESLAVCRTKSGKYAKRVIIAQCEHAFHLKCISEWMKRKHMCPLCRIDLTKCDYMFTERNTNKITQTDVNNILKSITDDLHNSDFRYFISVPLPPPPHQLTDTMHDGTDSLNGDESDNESSKYELVDNKLGDKSAAHNGSDKLS